MTHAEKRERRKVMAQAVASGTSMPEVARMFGVTLRLVQMACQEHGVKTSDARRRCSATPR